MLLVSTRQSPRSVCFSVAEAATLLGLDAPAVLAHIARGELVASQLSGEWRVWLDLGEHFALAVEESAARRRARDAAAAAEREQRRAATPAQQAERRRSLR